MGMTPTADQIPWRPVRVEVGRSQGSLSERWMGGQDPGPSGLGGMVVSFDASSAPQTQRQVGNEPMTGRFALALAGRRS